MTTSKKRKIAPISRMRDYLLLKNRPAWVKKTELFAHQLMTFYNATPLQNLYDEIMRKFKKKIPLIYYYILEDANYHTLNQALEDAGIFEKTNVKPVLEKYDQYRKAGGRTWEL